MDSEGLRRLVDAGNEDAADRLAALAAERGDVGQLRELVDAGHESAAQQLTTLAVERNDVDQLRWLVDAGLSPEELAALRRRLHGPS